MHTMAQSMGRFTGTIHVDDSPAGEDIRRLIELLEMILSWLWYNRQVVYLIADNIDDWVSVGSFLWVNRLTFHGAVVTIIRLGDVVYAALEACAVVWDVWLVVTRPLVVTG